jgi:integrase/recombinase XerD
MEFNYMELDYHGYKRRLKRILQRIKSSDEICEENKKEIFRFYRTCRIEEGLKASRLEKLLTHLFVVGKWMGNKKFTDSTKNDVLKLVERIETNEKWKELYKRDFKGALKKFYKWLRHTEEGFPEEVKWIKKTSKTGNNNKLPEELLTEKEIEKLIDAADSIRNKAFVGILYESGCRIGELLTLKLKNIQFDKYGCILLVNGKTGQRRIRIISFAPLLSKWLELHPFKDNPDAWLWVSTANSHRNKPLLYNSTLYLLKKLSERAEIKKKVNPHNFRHSRATHLAKHLTEAQMKQYFGWTQSSDMASIYVHMSGRDVDDALLKLNGLIPDEKEEQKIKIRICQRCRENNEPTARFCNRCGSPLDMKTMFELEEKQRIADEVTYSVLKELASDPEIEKLISTKISKLNLGEKIKQVSE